MIIRQANEIEYEEMLELQWKILFKPDGETKENAKKIILVGNGKNYYFIALINSEIEGAARLTKVDDEKARIEYLAIKDERKINRVGPSILNFMEWYARGLKVNKVLVYVKEQYKKALEKCKYERKRQVDSKMGNQEIKIWQKEL